MQIRMRRFLFWALWPWSSPSVSVWPLAATRRRRHRRGRPRMRWTPSGRGRAGRAPPCRDRAAQRSLRGSRERARERRAHGAAFERSRCRRGADRGPQVVASPLESRPRIAAISVSNCRRRDEPWRGPRALSAERSSRSPTASRSKDRMAACRALPRPCCRETGASGRDATRRPSRPRRRAAHR